MATRSKSRFPRSRDLPETDGEIPESYWYVVALSLLLDVVSYHRRNRPDYWCSGNSFIYYDAEQALAVRREVKAALAGRPVLKQAYRGPDFYFVDGVDRERLRDFWVVWEEGGRFPDVILELLSPQTARTDLTKKKRLYEQTFRTREYYCYDPDTRWLTGWRLDCRGRYRRLRPNAHGWLRCKVLNLWLGQWEGEVRGWHDIWPRFFTDSGQPLPTWAEGAYLELEEAIEHRKAVAGEIARLKAELSLLNDHSESTRKQRTKR